MGSQVDRTGVRVTCRRCSRACTERSGLMSWSHRRDRGGESWLCQPCTREAIQDIESGFDNP